jgi:hypothetical protein
MDSNLDAAAGENSCQYKVNLGHKPSGILDNEQTKEMVLDTR